MSSSHPEHEIFHREVEPDPEEAGGDLIEIISDLDNCDQDELEPLYSWVDDVIQDLYSDPPSPKAQVQIEFSYCGFRINMDQGGHVSLMKMST